MLQWGLDRLLPNALVVITFLFFALCLRIGLLPNGPFTELIQGPFILYMIFAVIRRLLFFLGAFRDKLEKLHRQAEADQITATPSITILVPAYNEEKVIGRTIQNLTSLDYPNYDVVIVDDGSRDHTLAIAQNFAAQSSRVPVQVVTKPNGGKAAALNVGLTHCSGDLILCVDADSRLTKGTLRAGVPHFQDPAVGAVAGFVEVGNQKSFLMLAQEIEYLIGLNFMRRSLSIFGIVPIIPGPVGMFRRQVFRNVGGFDTTHQIFAEDAELSLRMVSAGWQVRSEEDMLAITEAPESVRDLLRQRYRWNRGVFQAWRLNFRKLLDLAGLRGFFLMGVLFFEIYVATIVNSGMILMFVTHFLKTGEAALLTRWFGSLLAIEVLTVSLAVFKHRNLLRWVGVAVVAQFTYNYVLIFWRVLSLFDEWFETRMTWDKLDRSGHLSQGGRL